MAADGSAAAARAAEDRQWCGSPAPAPSSAEPRGGSVHWHVGSSGACTATPVPWPKSHRLVVVCPARACRRPGCRPRRACLNASPAERDRPAAPSLQASEAACCPSRAMVAACLSPCPSSGPSSAWHPRMLVPLPEVGLVGRPELCRRGTRRCCSQ